MHERSWFGMLLASCITLAACQGPDCDTACRDQHSDCLDDPSGYDGYSFCAQQGDHAQCARSVCGQAQDRCIAQCQNPPPQDPPLH